MAEFDSLNLEERAVRAVEAAYDAAWQTGNIEGLLACLTDDAVLVNPRNETARGHAEIRRELGVFLGGEAKGSRHTSFILRLEFVTADVAVVDGEALVESEQGKTALPLFTHRFTDILVKKENQWKIAHIRAYLLATRK